MIFDKSINIIPVSSKDKNDSKNSTKSENHIHVTSGLRRAESISVASWECNISVSLYPNVLHPVCNPLHCNRCIAVSAGVTDRQFSFELATAKRTYLLSCETEQDLHQWTVHLEKSVFGGRLYSGWLTKRGAYRKNWKRRCWWLPAFWLVIDDIMNVHECR